MILTGCKVKYMTFAQDCLLHCCNNEPTGPQNCEYTSTHREKKYYFIAAAAEKRKKMEFFHSTDTLKSYLSTGELESAKAAEQNARISFTAFAGDLEYMHKCMNTPRWYGRFYIYTYLHLDMLIAASQLGVDKVDLF